MCDTEHNIYKNIYENKTILLLPEAGVDKNLLHKAITKIQKEGIHVKISNLLHESSNNSLEKTTARYLKKENTQSIIIIRKDGDFISFQEKNRNEELVTRNFLSAEHLDKYLDKKNYKHNKEIHDILETTQKILAYFPKIILSHESKIYDEVFTDKGANGVMFGDLDKANISYLQEDEKDIFRKKLTDKITKKEMKPRSPEQMEILEKNHSIFKIKGSPLGGYSLTTVKGKQVAPIFQEDQNISLFEVWWSERNSIGTKLLQDACLRSERLGQTLAMFSKEDVIMFDLRFVKTKIKSNSGAHLWVFHPRTK